MSARAVQIVLGICCTVFFLALALHRVHLESVGTSLAHVNLVWIGTASLAYALDLVVRAWRWQIILRPLETISYPTVARALLVGYGLNVIMPARLGELLRAEFMKQTLGISRVWALTSIVIERLFDGMTVVACLAIGLFFSTEKNKTTEILIDVLATGAFIFCTIMLVVIIFARSLLPNLLNRFSSLSAQLKMVHRGFEVLRTRRALEIAALTMLVYLPEAVTLWCVVKSVGLQLNLTATLVLLGAASLSTLVPSGPAFLGTLQFAFALAVEFAGGLGATGVAAATVLQLYLFLPMAIVAVSIFVHGSGGILRFVLSKDDPDRARVDT